MDTPVMFTFEIRNDVTGETARFRGQGLNIEQAWKDGFANVTYGHINPSTSGGPGANLPHKLSVTLPDGTRVNRDRGEFESDKPFKGARSAANPAPKDSAQIRQAPRVQRFDEAAVPEAKPVREQEEEMLFGAEHS